MRIFHIDPEHSFSGGEVQVFLLMEGLRRLGHENVLVCSPDGEPCRRAREQGFRTFLVKVRNNIDLAALIRLKQILTSGQPDLVHLHTGRANWIGGLASRWAGFPALSTRRMDRKVKDNWRTRCIYSYLVLQTAAISPAVLAHLRRAGVPVERSRLIWSSIDPTGLRPRMVRDRVRRSLGVDARNTLLLSVGGLTKRKGFDVLIEAFARIRSPNTHLMIAGSGVEHDALRKLVTRRGLNGRVRLLGQRSDIPELLEACDLFVMPSRAEGLGIAALEAMASGKPIIASAVGGLADVVLHEETGLLVPPEDVLALVAAMSKLLNNPAKRSSYGKASLLRVHAQFHVDQMVCAYERLYSDVLREWLAR